MKLALLLLGTLISSDTLAYEQADLDKLINTHQCNHCDLSNADFSGQDLNHADFSSTNLKKANFTQAKLIGAWLAHTNLQNATL